MFLTDLLLAISWAYLCWSPVSSAIKIKMLNKEMLKWQVKIENDFREEQAIGMSGPLPLTITDQRFLVLHYLLSGGPLILWSNILGQ